jgi:uncharacterized protein (DUF433 family)
MNTVKIATLPVHSDPQIMSGIPVFRGTRVPAQTLFDYLLDGNTIDEFLDNFPSVTREQAINLLQLGSLYLLEGVATGENSH